jgi:hypothetical protein
MMNSDKTAAHEPAAQPRGSVNPCLRCGLVCVSLVAALWTTSAAAQPPKQPFGEGSHALRVLLHRAGLTPITSEWMLRDEAEDHPERILIISLGNQSWLQHFPYDLRSFHELGGAFLGASDRFSQEWLRPYQVVIGFDFVRIEPTSKLAYRGLADCPMVVPESDAACPVFEGLHRVATNRPTYLALDERAPSIAARFPVDCTTVNNTSTPRYFAVGGPIKQGRVLLMADHSVFINDMMLPTDNDNFDLAHNAIDWLTEYDPITKYHKRDRVLFMEDGRLVTDFNVPVKEVPTPSAEELLAALAGKEPEVMRAANAALVGLEKENYFNRQALGLVPLPFLVRGGLIALTILLAIFGLWKLIRSRYQLDPQLPQLAPALAVVAPSDAVLTQRQQAALIDGNFWETAHGLARQFFDTALHGTISLTVPSVGGTGTAPQLRAWRKQVGGLWRLAHAATPWCVSARQFQHLVADIDTLQTALASGLLKLST